MKNRVTTALLILMVPMLFTVSGCKKFLDRKPLTATLDDLNQGVEGQIFGMYSFLRTGEGFSTLPWIDFHSIRDDDAQKGSDASDGAEINTEFETFQYTKDDWATNSYWNNHYTMINQANEALYTIDSLKLTSDAAMRNVGEACFFRAYAYWELMKAYGEVPLFKQRLVNPTDGIKDKSTLTELYAFVDSNLQVATALLPPSSDAYGVGDQYKGRLTSGAAKTLWAQTYLFRQQWGQVVTLCNQIKASGQYQLLAEFSDLWRDGVSGQYKNSKESIFEMQAHTGEGARGNSAVDFGSGWGTCQQVRRNGAPIEWNLGWGWNTPTQKLVDDWPATDPRKEKTILFSGQSDGGTAKGGYGVTVPAYTNPDGNGGLAQRYWNKKLYTGNDPKDRILTGWVNADGNAPWINHRIFRYADVLLMLAEAANENGDGATAEANLELVRNRASGNLGPARVIVPKITFVDKAQMRTAIKNERRWEFAMEGYRFYDLVRWGDAVTVLGSLGYTNRCRYYPIPQDAIDLTGGVLKQNPEW
jgi:hypothetical protein